MWHWNCALRRIRVAYGPVLDYSPNAGLLFRSHRVLGFVLRLIGAMHRLMSLFA